MADEYTLSILLRAREQATTAWADAKAHLAALETETAAANEATKLLTRAQTQQLQAMARAALARGALAKATAAAAAAEAALAARSQATAGSEEAAALAAGSLAEARDRATAATLALRLAEDDLARANVAAAASADTAARGGFLGALAARLGMGGGGGKAAGGGGLLGALGWGGGIMGMAGMGSVLGFAGLGFEHVLMTALGLAGSAMGAGLGGGLLGAGALGTMAVGGGADMAVMKSTIADTQTLYQQYNALAQAVAVYGSNSIQAQAATAQLNFTMQSLGNTAGVQAEAGLARAASALNTLWDNATSNARIAAVNILMQVVNLGTQYVPLVADAAQRNLSIINDSLKPLFAWLEGPEGMGIFNELENIFATNLPTAMDAFTQGAEFVLKTVSMAATYTGGFTRALDNLLKRLNTPAGIGWWSVEIGNLINLFHTWWLLIKAVGTDIYLLFSQSLGLGTSIVTTLTQMLVKLGDWEKSTQGKAAIHNLFQVHKNEILALMKLIPPLVTAFGKLYFAIAPPATNVVTALADAFTKWPKVASILAWGLALGFVASKLVPLVGLILQIRRVTVLWTAAQWALNVAAEANPYVAAITAIIVVLILVITHWKTFTLWAGRAWDAMGRLRSAVWDILGPLGLFVSSLGWVVTHLQQIVAWGENAWRTLQKIGNNPIVKGLETAASTIGSVAWGTRATGGPVNAYGTYLVGERGPELLQMGSRSGTIVPNSAIGGNPQDSSNLSMIVQLLAQLVQNTQPGSSTGGAAALAAVLTDVAQNRSRGFASV